MRLRRFVLLWVIVLAAPPGVGAQPYLTPPPTAGVEDNVYSSAWAPPEGVAAPSATVDSTAGPASELLPTPSSAESPGEISAAAEAAAAGMVEERPRWYERAFLLVPEPWDTGIELGLNGSGGTNDSFSLRTGGYIKRESRFSKLDVSSYYNRTGAGGDVTQNNAQFDLRNDWLLDDKSPWTLFVTNTEFYDQFKNFDLQMNVDLGVGYRVFHEPGLELVARVGGGTSREFGGPDERWVPESLFGFEYSQQLNASQKFYGKLDYFPEWDQVGEYRLVADTGWEVVLVHPSNLSLKISATDRYDSTPNGAEPHLINYSVLLLLKL